MAETNKRATDYIDVITMFHSMPKTKREILPVVEEQYFLSALADYELSVGALGYDEDTNAFPTKLDYHVIYTLGLLMYTKYLRQELSRTLKLNGLSGKDITLTGVAAAKQYTYAELQNELEEAQKLLYKQMQHCYA